MEKMSSVPLDKECYMTFKHTRALGSQQDHCFLFSNYCLTSTTTNNTNNNHFSYLKVFSIEVCIITFYLPKHHDDLQPVHLLSVTSSVKPVFG